MKAWLLANIEHYYLDCLAILLVGLGSIFSQVENLLSFGTVALAFCIALLRLRKELKSKKNDEQGD